MKKIPTLFERQFGNHEVIGITDNITSGCEEALLHGQATIKVDGACCAIIGGELYKRYDAKKGKKPPEGAIPCCDPDPITGHWPHWVKVGDGPEDKWFRKAFENSSYIADLGPCTLTCEAVGPHFQGNPYELVDDLLLIHGTAKVDVDRNFFSIKEWLENHYEEGLVFWLNGEPVCKIKRSDFGLPWNQKGGKQ